MMEKSFDCKKCRRAKLTDGTCEVLLHPPIGQDCAYFQPLANTQEKEGTLDLQISRRAQELYDDFSLAFPGLSILDWEFAVRSFLKGSSKNKSSRSIIRRAMAITEDNLYVVCNDCNEMMDLNEVDLTTIWYCPSCGGGDPQITS